MTKIHIGAAMLGFGLCFAPHAASAGSCPVIITRVIERANYGGLEAQDQEPGIISLTTFYQANSPRFAHFEGFYLLQDGYHFSIERGPVTIEKNDGVYVAPEPSGFDVRQHGAPVDAWITDVIDTDGTRIPCAHVAPMRAFTQGGDPVVLTTRDSLSAPDRKERQNIANDDAP